jgi:small GTP-binding protein
MSPVFPTADEKLSVTGKSSLTVQFVENHFVESYYPTIENTFSKVIRYKGQDFATEIIDTAGQVS